MIGKKEWIVVDGFLPVKSNGDFISHESVCVLNTGEYDASIRLTIYFEDRAPMGEFFAVCKAKRTNHICLNKVENKNGNRIPIGIPYAIEILSDQPVIIQHTRMDTTQSEMALMTTMGY